MPEPLRIFIVEDEVLLLMQLEAILKKQGHVVAGSALSSCEAIAIAVDLRADVALIDVQLGGGPTGVEVARFINEQTKMAVVYMTANPKLIPEGDLGAIGVIAKPYTQEGLRSALAYVVALIRDPAATSAAPSSLTLMRRRGDTSGP